MAKLITKALAFAWVNTKVPERQSDKLVQPLGKTLREHIGIKNLQRYIDVGRRLDQYLRTTVCIHEGCYADTVACHSISECWQRTIAVDGRVWDLQWDNGDMVKLDGVFQPVTRPISQVSTSYSFCSAHDGELFRRIDSLYFPLTWDSILALNYRAAMHYILTHRHLRDDPQEKKSILVAYHMGQQAMRSLSGQRRPWKAVCLRLQNRLPFLASEMLAPAFGLDGQLLSSSGFQEPVFGHCVPHQTSSHQSAIVISWLGNGSFIPMRFANSITTTLRVDPNAAFRLLTMLENVAVCPQKVESARSLMHAIVRFRMFREFVPLELPFDIGALQVERVDFRKSV